MVRNSRVFSFSAQFGLVGVEYSAAKGHRVLSICRIPLVVIFLYCLSYAADVPQPVVFMLTDVSRIGSHGVQYRRAISISP